MNLPSRSKRSAGFTLVELLVVLVILGLLAALVAPRVLSYLGSSKTKTAQLQITSFTDALDLYRLDNQGLPTTAEGLKALVEGALTAIERPSAAPALPIDVAGTAFQEAVWRELRKIPLGETRSYAEIAAAIGQPKAV